MRKNKRGLEVQFMDSTDAEISAEELHQQLHDAFRADNTSAQDFVDSVFKPSESSKYDIDLQELGRDARKTNGNLSFLRDRRPIKDMRPSQRAKRTPATRSAFWLKRIWLGIFGKSALKNRPLGRG